MTLENIASISEFASTTVACRLIPSAPVIVSLEYPGLSSASMSSPCRLPVVDNPGILASTSRFAMLSQSVSRYGNRIPASSHCQTRTARACRIIPTLEHRAIDNRPGLDA
jgi:hypothetical protein